MKKILIAIFMLASFATYADSGILFIAHGTMGMTPGNGDHDGDHGGHHMMGCSTKPSTWESFVLNTVHSMKSEIKKNYEVSFGMWESHCFDLSIKKLKATMAAQGKTLDHLIVFPLFISSHSSVIEMQKYIFKKRADRVLEIPNVHQTTFEGKITYMNAFDYDPHISMILANRTHHLVHMAKEEGFAQKNMELVLVMHGPVEDDANIEWMKMGERYNRDISYLFPMAKAHVVSLRDDADDEVRNRATLELRQIVSNAEAQGRMPLILPLLISKGGIDKGIIKRLEGLNYVWSGESIFPDTKLRDVILHRLE